MLKSLELNGFKSFADRTRFEFPEGITAVVGPNGSGKSNVVDAIKWVLGFAKREGATRQGNDRRHFQRSKGPSANQCGPKSRLRSITPRAFRILTPTRSTSPGASIAAAKAEYLINRQTCRLRDIRELFSGTGVSTGAYSIIEQGKVDALLQSSPKERRMIFEEAAGVSRFKLKRQEAARRLERVDQNLLRLSDIVEELDSRLRSVRSQAGRARKYKEESDRLKLLRTQVALVDWRQLTETLRSHEQRAELASEAKEALQQQVVACDQQLAAAEEAADALQTVRPRSQ